MNALKVCVDPGAGAGALQRCVEYRNREILVEYVLSPEVHCPGRHAGGPEDQPGVGHGVGLLDLLDVKVRPGIVFSGVAGVEVEHACQRDPAESVT